MFGSVRFGLAVVLFALMCASTAFAFTVRAPEIDVLAGPAALMLLGGVMLAIRGRRR
jgi:hypothetical protein